MGGYTLYGIERIGVASGLKYIGDTDWYQWGATWCVNHQAADGGWQNLHDIDSTCLCVLFLARGRAPVVMNKVQYDNAAGSDKGQEAPWNERPRDVANFVHWMSRKTERDLNWQITNLTVPEPELHDAPILFFSGNKPISLTPAEQDKLRTFVETGGLILGNADCGGGNKGAFAESFVKLGKALFPDYEFRDLPADHPIYTDQQYPSRTWKSKVTLRGLSNGVRELMILMPNDPGKVFQMQDTIGTGRREAFESTNDIVLYCTDKQPLRFKGQLAVPTGMAAVSTKTIKVVRLKFDGNWDPEPAGWTRVTQLALKQDKLGVEVRTADLGKSMLGGFKLAVLTGTGKLQLSDAQKTQLKSYVTKGGTLLVDAAGGNSEFADSAKAILKDLFVSGDWPEPLPAESLIYAVARAGAGVHYRPFARSVLGSLRSPQIVALTVDGRPSVYFSREDLSAGLVGEPMDGIVGYTAESATDIVLGLLQVLAK